jgi:hypothetical protein
MKITSTDTTIKEFDKLLTECFSGNMRKLKYFTWKFKEKALRDFISQALIKREDEVRKEVLEDLLKNGSGGGNWRRIIMQRLSEGGVK